MEFCATSINANASLTILNNESHPSEWLSKSADIDKLLLLNHSAYNAFALSAMNG